VPVGIDAGMSEIKAAGQQMRDTMACIGTVPTGS
jgi:hypothetical protein